MTPVTIRPEQPGDTAGIRRVVEAAFGQPDEARLVDRLRVTCPETLSLVAERGGAIVGHILFTPVTVDGHRVIGRGLAPLAVLPAHQRDGVGSALVEAGLAALREQGCPFVIVLGHADYYPRFGFVRASTCGLRSQWPHVRDEVFMARILSTSAMVGVTGIARYRHEFDSME